MRKSIITSIIASSIIFNITGCETANTQQILSGANNHVGDVARVEKQIFTLPSDIAKSKNNQEGLKILSDNSNIYLVFSHDNLAKNIQFFLDTDNNSSTGSISEGGADFIIENGQLYIPTGDKGAKWETYTGDKNNISYNATELEDSVKISKKLLKNNFFGAKAQVLDEHWMPKVSSPSVLPKTYFDVNMTNYDNLLTLDAYAQSTNDNFTIKINNENSKALDILLIGGSRIDKAQLYIDSDNDKNTGYKSPLWDNMGADYMIEFGKLYFRTTDNSWGWSYQRDVPHLLFNEPQKSISLNLQKSALKNLANEIKIAVEINDEKWENSHPVPEDSELEIYEH